MCATSPTLISRRSCTVATMLTPDRDYMQIVDMPWRVAALAEVHHGAVILLRITGLGDGW
jgi:hypothetical protein